MNMWDDNDYCYECTGYGDDWYEDENGELQSRCGDCPFNPSYDPEEDWLCTTASSTFGREALCGDNTSKTGKHQKNRTTIHPTAGLSSWRITAGWITSVLDVITSAIWTTM